MYNILIYIGINTRWRIKCCAAYK